MHGDYPGFSVRLRGARMVPNSLAMSQNLPIVPMRTGVIFPGVSLPITAARPQTLRAIEAALRDPEHRVFAVSQKGDVDQVIAEGLYTVGTVATLSSVQRGPGGVGRGAG